MRPCGRGFPIPSELAGEDVYDTLFIFDNEEEAIDYVVKEYNLDRDALLQELYEEDAMREKFGKELYFRSASITRDLSLYELMSGEYILWEGY